MRPIIRVENLGKQYCIGAKKAQYATLRDKVADAVRRPFSSGGSSLRQTIWALEGVTFAVERGEVLGIIGHNGAGKSTLLKVLARITEPTSGSADIFARVASLLEVGTGFHGELTGRDNIFLNGAILGMRRDEIKRKFDEIVAFAEIEKFIDTAVKHYSTGMYLRLAFAVAAHLQPEILIIDEVLAVGDASFQQKCLGKMKDVSRQGRTVLFVSHDMSAVEQLCDRAILLQSGAIADEGDVESVVGGYFAGVQSSNNGYFDLAVHRARPSHCRSIIKGLTLYSGEATPTTNYFPGDKFIADVIVEPEEPIRDPRIALAIEGHLGQRVTTVASYFQREPLGVFRGRTVIRCVIPSLALGSGRYLVSLSINTKELGTLDSLPCIASFEVGWKNSYGNGEPYFPVYGPVLTSAIWEQNPARTE